MKQNNSQNTTKTRSNVDVGNDPPLSNPDASKSYTTPASFLDGNQNLGSVISTESLNKKGIAIKIIKKILIGLIVLSILAGLSYAGYLFYFRYINPVGIISKSVESTQKLESFTINFNFPKKDGSPSIEAFADYHKSPNIYSRAQLSINNMGNDPANSVLFMIIANKSSIFLQGSYSKYEILENTIKRDTPEILALESYKLFKPLITGEKWLEIIVPENVSGTSSDKSITIPKDNEIQLNKKLTKCFLTKKFDRNFQINDKTYYKIIFGFKKKELIEFTEFLKTLDLEINIKDINSLIKIIQSSDDWDEDIFELLIEKDSLYLRSVKISLPIIPEGALKSSLEDGLEDNSTLSFLKDYLTEKSETFFKNKQGSPEKLVEIVEISLTNYNNAPQSSKPVNITTSDDLLNTLKQDLPYLMSLILPTNSYQLPLDNSNPSKNNPYILPENITE